MVSISDLCILAIKGRSRYERPDYSGIHSSPQCVNIMRLRRSWQYKHDLATPIARVVNMTRFTALRIVSKETSYNSKRATSKKNSNAVSQSLWRIKGL